MADISNEILDFQEAEYGEEVRDSMISLANKVNKESTDAKTAAQKALADTVDAAQKANTAAATANTAATNANAAKDTANAAATNANTKAQLADSKATLAATAASNADTKAQACQTATTGANTAATNANNKASAAQTATSAANTAATNANAARDAANTAASNANTKASAANTAATAANDAAAKALAAAGGEISEKTVTYTESTAATAPASGSKLTSITGWLISKVKNLVTRMGTAETSINQLNSDMPYLKTYTYPVGTRDLNVTARDGSGISKNWIAENMPNSIVKIEASTIGTSSPNYTCGIMSSGYFQEVCSLGTGSNRTIAYMDAYGYLKIKMPEVQTQKYVSQVILTFL